MANLGLKRFNKQFTQSVGNAGEVNINLRKNDANFILTLPILSTGGSNPIDISLIYNHQDRNENLGFGYGLKPSYFREWYNDVYDFHTKNPDGSTDYFYDNQKRINNDTNEQFHFTEADDGTIESCSIQNLKYNLWTEYLYETSYFFPIEINTLKGKITISGNDNQQIITNEYGDKIQVIKESQTEWSYKYFNKPQNSNTYIYKYSVEVTYSASKKLDIVKKIDTTLINEVCVEFNNDSIIVTDITNNISNKYVLINNVVSKILTKTGEVFDESRYIQINYISPTLTTVDNKSCFENEDGTQFIKITTYTYIFNNDNYDVTIIDPLGFSSTQKYNGIDLVYESNSIPSNNIEHNLCYGLSFNNFIIDSGITHTVNTITNSYSSIFNNTYDTFSGSGSIKKEIQCDIKTGQTYTLSIWMKNESVFTNSSGISIYFGNKFHIEKMNRSTISNEFELYTFGFVADKDYTSVQFRIDVFGSASISLAGLQLINRIDGTEYTYKDYHQITYTQRGPYKSLVTYDEKHLPSYFESVSSAQSILRDDDNRIVQSDSPYGLKTTYTYDGTYKNNIIKTITYSNLQDKYMLSQLGYGSNGKNVTSESDAFSHNTSYTYDSLGRKNSITDPKGVTTNITYDQIFLKTLGIGNVINESTYEDGQLINAKAPNNSEYDYTYDDYGRILSVKMDDITIISYIYDDRNNKVTKISNDGTRFIFTFDDFEKLLSIDKEVNNVITHMYNFIYDSLLRLKQVLGEDDEILVTYEYDYNDNIVSEVRSGQTCKYKYNTKNSLIYETNDVDNYKTSTEYYSIEASQSYSQEKMLSTLISSNKYCVALFVLNADLVGNKVSYQRLPYSGETVINDSTLGTLQYQNFHYYDMKNTYQLAYSFPSKSPYPVGVESGSAGFWYYPTNINSLQYIFSCVSSYNTADKIIAFIYNQKIYLKVICEGKEKLSLCSSANLKQNEWNYFSASWYMESLENGENPCKEFTLISNGEYKISTEYFENRHSECYELYMGTNPLICIGYDIAYNSYPVINKIAALMISNREYLSIEEQLDYYYNSYMYVINSKSRLSEDKIKDYSISCTYDYASYVKNTFEIFSLHQNFESINGIKPYVYTRKNRYLTDVDRSDFVLDNDNKNYVYVASGNILQYSPGLGSSGTFAIRFKTYQNASTRYVFDAISGGRHLALYVGANNKLYLKFLYSTYNTGHTITNGEWHNVALSYNTTITSDSAEDKITVSARVYIDGTVYNYNAIVNSQLTNPLIMVGRQYYDDTPITSYGLISTSKLCYPLNGLLDTFAYANAYCEKSTIERLFSDSYGVKHVCEYDDFGRLILERVINKNTEICKKKYNYKNCQIDNKTYTSNQISSEIIYRKGTYDAAFVYNYDNNGQIIQINLENSPLHTYTYNNLGFLTSDNNINLQYDTNGNIVSKGTQTYIYDNNVKDKLISYNGIPVTYDSDSSLYIKSCTNKTYSYEGNRLTSVVNSTTGITSYYQYNENGLRTKKTNSNGTESTYFYSGNRLVTEINTNYRNDYLYDENGNLFGFIYNKQTYYFYLRDITQNIIGIISSDGDNVVYYDYSAFGSVSTTGTLANTIGKYNPFRFKGYYYDVETKLYWVSSRYYSPELCRWISPDSIEYLDPESINGLNLYAYCGNDPVNRFDPTGHAFISVLVGLGIAALIGAGIGMASYTAGQLIDYAITGDFKWSWGGFFGSTIGGAVGGMLAYLLPYIGIGSAAVGAFFSGAATTAGTMIGQNITDNAGYSAMDILFSSAITGVFSAVSVGVMSKIRIPGLNAGRGSYSAVSSQMYTKFRNRTISRITMRTFGKMFAAEAYSGIVGSIFEDAYGYSGIDDWLLNRF